MDKALEMIVSERIRQQTQEGFTPEDDDRRTDGELGRLAAAYVTSSLSLLPMEKKRSVYPAFFMLPDEGFDYKPKDPIRDLVRAGALILAELERRLRLKEAP